MSSETQKYWEYWSTCISYLERDSSEKAVSYAKKIAEQLKVPETLVNRIFAVNLSSYAVKIDRYLEPCIQRAKNERAKAICLYYSMDNGWESTLYICKDFSREESSWICASRSWMEIGKARGFSCIYKKEAKSTFLADDISTGICILLMVRTTIAFKNVADQYKDCGLHICITCTESDFVELI